ncbi:MAG: hypothetical protein NC090_00855 [Anaeroplasma bactoclasticum]|nr:hypothetical protein [Anaeroplasma bactoclasticum]
MNFITSTKIAQLFSGSRKGQGIFPELIKRLIIASCNRRGNIRFPSGDAIWAYGFDGVIENVTVDTNYVPIGNSIWEVGTNENSLKKINADYDKRSKELTDYDKREYTFLLVSSNIFGINILDWEYSKNQEKIWKQVILIDAEKISDWIEENIEVGVWLLEQFSEGKNIDVDTFQSKWNKVVNITSPQFNSKIMINSNRDKMEELYTYFESAQHKFLTIKSYQGTEHVLYFLLGSLFELGKKEIKEKIIFANNVDSLNYIKKNCKDKIVITKFYQDIILGDDNLYIIMISETERGIETILNLNYCTHVNFTKALESMGLQNIDASELSAKVNKNLSILKRQLAIEPCVKQPKWTKDSNRDSIIPLLLVTEFNKNDKYDREVLKIISGIKFDEYLLSLDKWVGKDDSPVFRYNFIYKINSKEECFKIIDISSVYITRLVSSLKKIFNCENEKYNLAPEQWHYSSVYGIKEKYKTYLVEGILDSLILYSNISDKNQECCDKHIEEILNNIMNNENLVFNIAPYFPKIAELSPNIFLDFLETNLYFKNLAVSNLIEKRYNGFLPECDESHFKYICWALDICCQMDNICIRALNIYLKIYFSDYTILEHFHFAEKIASYFSLVSTNIIPLKIQDKIQLLKDKLSRYDNSKSEKILELFISRRNLSRGISISPKWKRNNNVIKLSDSDIDFYYQFAIYWLIDNTKDYSVWLKNAFDFINYVPSKNIYHFFEKLKEKIATFDDNYKYKIYKIILYEIYDMKMYIESRKYKIKFLDCFEQLLEISEPTDVFLKYKYRLEAKPYYFPLKNPEPYNQNNYKNYTRINDLKREEELNETFQVLYSYYRNDATDKIVETVSNESQIGKLLLQYEHNHSKLILSLFKLGKYNLLFNCFINIEPFKLMKIIESYDEEIQFNIIPLLPLNENTINFVKRKKNEDLFWKNQTLYGIENEDVFKKAYDRLLHFFPIKVIDYLANPDYRFNVEKMKQALLSFIKNPIGLDFENNYISLICDFINKLDNMVYDEEIVFCEFKLLPILKSEALSLGIKKYFWNNPSVLVELLSKVYSNDFKDEELKNLLLYPLNRCLIPEEYISLYPDKLKKWVKILLDASQTLDDKEKDLVQRTIMHTISFEKEKDGEVWPSNNVSDILELISNREILSQFIISKINSRGARTIEDGTMEYNIMNQYFSYAEHYKLKSSTNYVLTQIATSYKENADDDRMEAILL